MRKVIGMGETIMDIIFHGAQPTAAVPGGSSFNSIISIGRAGIPGRFRRRNGTRRGGTANRGLPERQPCGHQLPADAQ